MFCFKFLFWNNYRLTGSHLKMYREFLYALHPISLMLTFCIAKIQYQNQNFDIGTIQTHVLVCVCVCVCVLV